MLVGTPCIATLSKGMLTSIDPGRTGLAFPTGDAAFLAWQFAKVFDNDDVAVQIGVQARIVARQRHDPAHVEQQLLSAYRELETHRTGARAQTIADSCPTGCVNVERIS